MQLNQPISSCDQPAFRYSRQLRLLVIIELLLVLGFWTALPLQADFHDPFESSTVAWKLHHSDCQARILNQKRQFQQSHAGAGCEWIQLQMARGTYAHLSYSIPPVRVIDELQPSLWIKSNRTSLQIMARVVLPRTLDPQSGKPLKFLIRGSHYELAGQWQRISISRCREAVLRQIPSLRSQFGSTVTPKQAFIDMVVINAYGGSGLTNLWIDDLRITTPVVDDLASRPTATHLNPIVQANHQARPIPLGNPARVQGNLLLVEKRPFFPRIIQYNGESFQWLQRIGFNTIALRQPPTPHQVAEAKRLGLWLTVPPEANVANQSSSVLPDRCIAFDLGERLTEQHLAAVRSTVASIQDQDQEDPALVVAAPSTMLDAYSRQCNLIRLPWNPLHGSDHLNACIHSLRQRIAELQHGTPYWITIPTQPSATLISQWNAFGTQHLFPRNLEPEQVRFLAFAALASGARGLYFQSWSRLDAPDTGSEIRANTLESLNHELRLIQPWIAGGVFLGDLLTRSTDVRASTWQTDRAKLVILLRSSAQQQFVTSPIQSKAFTFDAPGTPITYRPYHLHPDGVRTLQPTRGNQIPLTMETNQRVSLIVLTADQLVRDYLYDQTGQQRERQSHLALKQVINRHHQFKQIMGSLPTQVVPAKARQTLQATEDHLSQSQALLNRGDQTGANQFTSKADHALQQLRWNLWNQAVRFFPDPVSSPYCVNFQTLPNHWELVEHTRRGKWGMNILEASDFESLPALVRAGWSHQQEASPGYNGAAELAPGETHSGNYALHLFHRPDPQQKPVPSSKKPRLRISSGPIPVETGTLLRIHGWVKVAPSSQEHSDGLLIYDSLGGALLGDRIYPTIGWQEFILYRASPRKGTFQFICELEGIGEAWLDSLSVQVLDRSPRDPGRNPSSGN